MVAVAVGVVVVVVVGLVVVVVGVVVIVVVVAAIGEVVVDVGATCGSPGHHGIETGVGRPLLFCTLSEFSELFAPIRVGPPHCDADTGQSRWGVIVIVGVVVVGIVIVVVVVVILSNYNIVYSLTLHM